MKKKVFSALLLAAFAFMATSTITSCKDYDDDINNLQKQIDANKHGYWSKDPDLWYQG